MNRKLQVNTEKLSQWTATSIAGIDLLSSLLYTIGITTTVAGKWAPVSLLIVSCGILYPFKLIYEEIGNALPFNGGSFNCILLATSNPLFKDDEDDFEISASTFLRSPTEPTARPWLKIIAASAGTLSLFSYAATAVVSAQSSISYGASEYAILKDYQWHLTLVLLTAFALVTLSGIKESSQIALVLFSIHLLTLTVLCIGGIYHMFLVDRLTTWNANMAHSDEEILRVGVGSGTWYQNIIMGVSCALLGITGFETSSNYIEQQGPGVFAKTLRNMWILVTVLNPLTSCISLGVLQLKDFPQHKDSLLSQVAELSVGQGFRLLVTIDAMMALSGGILTAFIGVTGLITRMTTEHMLPKIFLQTNRYAGSQHYAIGGFWLMATLIFISSRGDLAVSAGVYTVSFIGVLGVAVIGCVLLRQRQQPLRVYSPNAPRKKTTRWLTFDIVAGFAGVLFGLFSQIILQPQHFLVFFMYYGALMLVILLYYAQAK